MTTPPPNPLPTDELLPATETPTVQVLAPPSSDPPWSIGDVLLLAALSFAALTILQIVALGIGSHLHPDQTILQIAKNARYLVPPQVIGYALILAYMIAMVRSRGLSFWNGIRWRWPNRWILFALSGLALAVCNQILGTQLPIPKDTPFQEYFSDTTTAYLMAIMAVFFAPLMEELFFRGFLYPALAGKIGVAASVIITSVCFTLIHAQQLAVSWAPLLLIFIVGLTLTIVRARTGSVASSFLIHFGYNFTLLTVAFFATDHFRHFEKMR